MLLENGSMIKQDIIDSFNNAVINPENLNASGGVNWNFVDSDLYIDLLGIYSDQYLSDCISVLVDNYYS